MLSKSEDSVKSLRSNSSGQNQNSQATHSGSEANDDQSDSVTLEKSDLDILDSVLLNKIGAERVRLLDYIDLAEICRSEPGPWEGFIQNSQAEIEQLERVRRKLRRMALKFY